jgi:chromosome segregation ATPase
MEDFVNQYGSALAVFAFLVVNWWRTRNDAKSVQAKSIEVLTAANTSNVATIMSLQSRVEVVENERSAEREAANVARIQLQNRIEKLEDEQRASLAQIADLKRQIEVLQQEGRNKDGLLEQLRKRVNALEKENCTLAAEKDKLENRLAEMQRALVASEKRAETQAAQIDELKKRGTGPLSEQPSSGADAPLSTAERAETTPPAGETPSDLKEPEEK